MNILIYIPDISQAWGGIRQYAMGLIRTLAQDSSNKYFIYHNGDDSEVNKALAQCSNLLLVQDLYSNNSTFKKQIVRVKKIANFIFKKIRIDSRFSILNSIDKIVDKYNVDIIHCPYQFVPHTDRAKLILTLHDVQELHFPEFFTPEERAYRATNYLDFIKRSDAIIVSYGHIKYDLVKYFNVAPNKIDVVLLDMSELWFKKYINNSTEFPVTLNLFERFIFYPANTWEHKNHKNLLKSLFSLKEKGILVNLICSGHQNQYYTDVIAGLVKDLGLESQVKFLGVVDESTLYKLYKNCVGVIIPTLYEAGSFPLMESILMSIPVICSNVTSLPETIGNEFFTFDPISIQSISAKIEFLWNSEEFRQFSINNSRKMQKYLTDTNALTNILALYKNINFN